MGRRTQKSQKKSKFIFLVILIAALISLTGTYAWFSTQRDVEIVGFRINVEVAENLEISLDGEVWVHTINIEDMRQFYGTYTDEDTTTVTYQAKKNKNRNYVPTELLPVSTIGAVEDGNMIFAIGEVKDRVLSDIKKCSETDIVAGTDTDKAKDIILAREGNNSQHPYLVFDMYLKNLSRLSDAGDPLYLREGSSVTASSTGTGLENSVRVGFVQYENTVAINYQESDVGDKIRGIASSDDDSEKVAIWEPNAKYHIPYVITNDDRITAEVQDPVTTYAIAVTKAALPKTQIDDIRDSDDTLLQAITTNTPEQGTGDNKFKTTSDAGGEGQALKYTDGTAMKLKPNQITKVRCYVWLEGQDPDCVDLASTGDEVVITMRLIKPKSNIQGGNSYAD